MSISFDAFNTFCCYSVQYNGNNSDFSWSKNALTDSKGFAKTKAKSKPLKAVESIKFITLSDPTPIATPSPIAGKAVPKSFGGAILIRFPF